MPIVHPITHASCQQAITLGHAPTKLLLSQLGEENCGFENTPLTLEAEPGQVLNISLYDLTGSASEGPHSQCGVNYGRVLDVSNSAIADVCSGRGRAKQLMTTNGNTMQIILSQDSFENNQLMLEIEGK